MDLDTQSSWQNAEAITTVKLKYKYIRVEGQNGQWRYVAPNIKCRADRVGCFVYIYDLKDGRGEFGVLAPNQREAIAAIDAEKEIETDKDQTSFA